jgi:hypothetical protein
MAGLRRCLLFNCMLSSIPVHAVIQFDTTTPETVKRASNGQVHLAFAEILDAVQVLQAPATPGVSDWYGAPLGQPLD